MVFKKSFFTTCCYLLFLLGLLQFTLRGDALCCNPLLVTVLMVKNEEPVIQATLRPLIQGGITAFLIYDTGSTDRTIEKARQLFHEMGITNFKILQEPFVDFAVSRNRALDLADHYFPHACFMLMPDAEWQLQNVPRLLKFCADNYHNGESSYLMRIVHDNQLGYYVRRLIKGKSKLRFKGVVHEYLDSATPAKVPDEIFFAWTSTNYGQKKSHTRWFWDRDVLLQEYYTNPDDGRTVFYLAQTYAVLDDLENAHQYYKVRAEMDGWPEEKFVAMYRVGKITEQLAATRTPTHKKYTQEMALEYYLKAFAIRPTRIEPLVKIAQYYIRSGAYHYAYPFILLAATIPYPKDDLIFVENELYNSVRYSLLNQCKERVEVNP